MSVIHWVHMSDLHLNKIGFQTENMREKLPNYIKELAKERPINYIFFTGDARHAPDIKFQNKLEKYFSLLNDAAGIDKSHLHIVMGNHDVDRDDTIRLNAIKHVMEHYDRDDSVISNDIIKKLKSGRNGYNALFKRIMDPNHFKHHASYKKLHYVVVTDAVNIVHVDSTLVYTRENQKDLLIGTYALKQALLECDATKPTILLSHYSLDCFSPKEQDAILQLLKDYHVQIWLAGHKHHNIVYKDRDFFYVAHSGNQTFEKGTTPSFVEGILDTDAGKGHFIVHKWNESTDWAVYQTLISCDKDDEKNLVIGQNILLF